MEQFVNDLKEWNIKISDEQLNLFEKYTALLLEWNEKINLTAITDINDIYKKHYLDSLSLVKCIKDLGDKEYTLLDLGTGAGFPGIPLKIMFPNLKITLVDSLRKRVDYLNLVIDELGLENIHAIHSRAEVLAHDEVYREKYDIVVSRAVANLSVLSEYCIPFVKLGGVFVSYKAADSNAELSSASNAIGMLGGKKAKTFEFVLPDSDYSRCNILIEKKKNTEDRFPRKEGVPSKRPL
ncbi:MAG: 16S rRNA (guanine(527)-N(7))-methyltransferase RsmG [Lachnospiraceae bacterium]|nr:16S rRNA (guanine(527)-N(7))-methyltransferase RsmG [Lachnospiraceae bacterium]